MEDLLGRLSASTEAKRARFGEGFGDLAKEHGLLDWEGWFHPYDSEVHQTVAQHVLAQDVVLEIGAGDLRLALRLSQRAQRVYAVEVNSGLLQWAMQEIGPELPHNLHVICANALYAPIPRDVTVAVLLMRHCQHFGTYFDRLQAAGCHHLITNARWKSGIEVIELAAERVPLSSVTEGWYACRCGAVGYVGKGERPEAVPIEVSDCAACGRLESTLGEKNAS